MIWLLALHRALLSCPTSCMVAVVGWCLPHSMWWMFSFSNTFTTFIVAIRLDQRLCKALSLFLPVIWCTKPPILIGQFSLCVPWLKCWASILQVTNQTTRKTEKGRFSYWTSNHFGGGDDLSLSSRIPLLRGLVISTTILAHKYGPLTFPLVSASIFSISLIKPAALAPLFVFIQPKGRSRVHTHIVTTVNMIFEGFKVSSYSCKITA
jgi:hypothetical protein